MSASSRLSSLTPRLCCAILHSPTDIRSIDRDTLRFHQEKEKPGRCNKEATSCRSAPGKHKRWSKSCFRNERECPVLCDFSLYFFGVARLCLCVPEFSGSPSTWQEDSDEPAVVVGETKETKGLNTATTRLALLSHYVLRNTVLMPDVRPGSANERRRCD